MTEFNDKQIEILQVAEKLFAEDGFDGTSIRQIAKEAKVNIAMISYYFGSKEKLLETLILDRTSGMKMQLENIYRDDLTPIEKVERLIDTFRGFGQKTPISIVMGIIYSRISARPAIFISP